jgi:hypothetical protein
MESCKHKRFSIIQIQGYRYGSLYVLKRCSYRSAANEPHNEFLMEDDEDDGWVGNRRRTLWKKTCTQAALDVRLSNCFTLSPHLSPWHVYSTAFRTPNARYMPR